jgi:high-affinity Fe2+/Pb2+ permease
MEAAKAMALQLRRSLPWLAVGVAIAAVFGFLVWTLFATRGFGSMTGGSRALAVLITAGVVGTGALAAVLMWLAFYSDRKGYDDPPTFDDHEP